MNVGLGPALTAFLQGVATNCCSGCCSGRHTDLLSSKTILGHVCFSVLLGNQLMKGTCMQFIIRPKAVHSCAEEYELISGVSLSMPSAGKRKQSPYLSLCFNCMSASFSKIRRQDHISVPCIISSLLLLRTVFCLLFPIRIQ